VVQWLFTVAIVAAALACPALMWLGRRGIGPGCAICPPARTPDKPIEALKARQRSLAAKIDRLEGRETESVASVRD
jgi:hypothetical protein